MVVFEGRIAMVSPWIESGTIIDYLKSHPSVDRLPLVRNTDYLTSLTFDLGNLISAYKWPQD